MIDAPPGDRPVRNPPLDGGAAIRAAVDAPVITAYPGGSGSGHVSDLELADLPRNDSGNADRLIARHGADMRYVRGVGWHYWDQNHWCHRGADEQIHKFTRDTAAMIIAED
jgi:hypothetical protein